MKNTVFQFRLSRTESYLIKKTIEMLKIILATLLIVAICIVLLSVKILFKKNGRFPNTHVSGSKAMRKRGIGCVQSQDREAQKVNPHAIAERRRPETETEKTINN